MYDKGHDAAGSAGRDAGDDRAEGSAGVSDDVRVLTVARDGAEFGGLAGTGVLDDDCTGGTADDHSGASAGGVRSRGLRAERTSSPELVPAAVAPSEGAQPAARHYPPRRPGGLPSPPPPIPPVRLPEVVSSIVDWLDDPLTAATLRASEAGGDTFQRPRLRPDMSVDDIRVAERDRLLRATYYAVTPEMMDLVFEAAKSLPECRLHPEDIPSQDGFCYFPTPLAYSQPHDTAISAVSWSTNDAGVFVTWYASEIAAIAVDELDPRLSRLVRTVPPGGLAYFAETELPFRNGDPFRYWDHGEDVSHHVLPLITTWLLMGESFVGEETVLPDRGTRRRLQREGRTTNGVRLLTLRRGTGAREAGGDDPAPREYNHRWIVRGHWRQHWYPSRQDHRPRWIAPHVKGPDDKPLAGGERVYLLRR